MFSITITGRSCTPFRGGREDDDDDDEAPLDSSCKRALRLRYDNIIGPFDNLLEGSKIIVFPEGELHRVPFQAMMDENGNYLSERSVCNQAGSILDYRQVNPRQPNGLSLWEVCSDCGRYRCWSSFVERKKYIYK